jgi:uncharacterized membrane protein SirB2
MKLFLIEALIAAFVVLCIMAVKYRSPRARETLRLARNAAWIYIAVIVVLAVVQVTVQ